jgi:argininosuccinate synthase
MNRVLLAFSGGLDTTYCARYLAVDHGMEVHTVVVNTGGFSADELDRIAARAHACGVASHTAVDCTQELYDRVLRYCIAGNVLKNATYPLSVSAERIVQATAIAQHALKIGATHLAHGSTGAGNDQVRFDVVFRILCPDLPVLTPIRDQQLSRADEIAYVTQHGVEGEWTKAAYSINQGLWGTSVGGRETLTSNEPLPESAWPSSALPIPAATDSERIVVRFEAGHPVAVNGAQMNPVDAIRLLNDRGSYWRIGRDMHVGDTIIGIKGRVAFEAPAAMMIIKAHHLLEKHTLTKWQLMFKDQYALWYGQLLHEGNALEPAMRDIEAFLESSQRHVTGDVIIRCTLGSFLLEGIESANDLMRSSVATYGEEQKAWTGQDVRGFARIAAMQTTVWHGVHGEDAQ